MKFMQDAATREQLEVDQQVHRFVRELDENGEDSDDGDVLEQPAGTAVERVGGRMSFRPGPTTSSNPLPTVAPAPSDTSSTTLRTDDLPASSSTHTPVTPAAESSKKSNPWLDRSTGHNNLPKRSEIAVGKDSKAAEKAKDKLNKKKRLHEDERERAEEDAVLEISNGDVLKLLVASPPKSAPKPAKNPIGSEEDSSDHNSEVEEQERTLNRKKNKANKSHSTALEQRELVALAFAGDNVVQDFQAAKQREIQADAPTEIDTTLPGWGAWGGAGLRKKASKPHLIKKVAGVDPKSRADYGKNHVVISERSDKKAAKYLTTDLPYPYTSKAQYERSLATPIGTEWSTRLAFQRATLPKVTKKMGVIINPLQKT